MNTSTGAGRAKRAVSKVGTGLKSRADLVERIEALEKDVVELRRHNLRLAELADLVQELLIPMASQDQERIDAALVKFTDSL